MILYLEEEITRETVDKLIAALKEAGDQGELDIYFASNGGARYLSDVIVDIINAHWNKITLIAHSDLQSAAFEVFFKSKCPRRVMPQAIGMYHQSYADFTLNCSKKIVSESDRLVLKGMNTVALQEMSGLLSSLGATEKEIRKFKRGDDVWFDSSRLQEMLGYQYKNEVKLCADAILPEQGT